MNRVGRLLVVLVVLGMGVPVVAAQRVAPDHDRAAIRHVIAGQILAFEQDNGAAAFGYSSPQLRARFQNAGNFMKMVRENYAPVYRPTQLSFGPLDDVGAGTKVQHLLVVDTDGNTHAALFVMERQKNGTWLVAGCLLTETNLIAT